MHQFLSQKFKFFSFLSMVLLVFVHGYDLNKRYLLPFTVVDEPLTVNIFVQYLIANGIFRYRIPVLFIISGYLRYAFIPVFAFANSITHYRMLMFVLLPTAIIGLSVIVGATTRAFTPKVHSILTGGRGFARSPDIVGRRTCFPL